MADKIKIKKLLKITAAVIAFLIFHPRMIVTEQLTITTYYPSPYGAYVTILTIGQTILARDSGNVGIGTTAPAGKLDVYGDAIVRSSFVVSGVGLSGTDPVFQVAGSTMVVQYNGNVGIGTTAPAAKLHVNGNIIANYPTAPNQVSLCIQCFWNGARRLTGDGGTVDDYYVCCRNGCITKFGYFRNYPWTCP